MVPVANPKQWVHKGSVRAIVREVFFLVHQFESTRQGNLLDGGASQCHLALPQASVRSRKPQSSVAVKAAHMTLA